VLTALAFLMASMPQIPHFTHASCIWILQTSSPTSVQKPN
jgi:hypothetical protein